MIILDKKREMVICLSWIQNYQFKDKKKYKQMKIRMDLEIIQKKEGIIN